MTDSLTLIDASERLGVHYMTTYRYVRTGRLAAHKVGGQWRVELEEIERFEAGVADPLPRQIVLPPMIAERLMAGDENGSFQLFDSAMASGADIEEVYLDLLAPAMALIGQRWHEGTASISDEHVASSTALRVVARLGLRVSKRGRSRGTIVIASVAGDLHYLPTAMMRDLLRFRGFTIIDLGAHTPPGSILERAEKVGDGLVAIGLAATNSGCDDVVRVTLSALNETVTVPIVVGGGAFTGVEHIAELGECVPTTSARNALQLFDQIHVELRAR